MLSRLKVGNKWKKNCGWYLRQIAIYICQSGVTCNLFERYLQLQEIFSSINAFTISTFTSSPSRYLIYLRYLCYFDGDIELITTVPLISTVSCLSDFVSKWTRSVKAFELAKIIFFFFQTILKPKDRFHPKLFTLLLQEQNVLFKKFQGIFLKLPKYIFKI